MSGERKLIGQWEGEGWIAGTERKEKSGGNFLKGILYGVKDRRLGEFVRGRTGIKNHLA
jgi:hypothetical protein